MSTATNQRNDESSVISRMRRHRLNGLAEMAGGMAHEINQPLGGIRGFAECILIGMEEGWDIGKDEIMAKMRRIIAEADRIDELIQSVRGFADEDGRLDLVPVDLGRAAQAAVRLLGSRLQAHGIAVAFAPPAGPVMVRANPFALQEVVQILLGNAGDACLARGPGHDGAVAIAIECGDNAAGPAAIMVTDNGVGMDAATLARAGEPFFTTKGPDRGTGLGLAMARGILAACGGQLELTSVAGVGTTARVRLLHRVAAGGQA